MKRKIYNYLKEWKNSSNRQPLLITGARQTGKTYIINKFANEYKNFVYCTLEIEKPIREIFENSNGDPRKIIEDIARLKKTNIYPSETLIILDEIQACPQAITMLKYFNEMCNEFHIIASGSLLGVSINRNNVSFPVGRIQMYELKPLDFEEFLWAYDKDNYLLKEINRCYSSMSSMPNYLHEQLLNLYKDYLFVGGMPECIKTYLNSNNEFLIKQEQKKIVDQYLIDMAKYNNPGNVTKTRLVFENTPMQLAKENKKFKYSLLKQGAKCREYESAIEWLSLTGIVSKLNRLEQIKIPLNAYRSNDFKLYLNDTGLLCYLEGLTYQDLNNSLSNIEFKGGLTENYVFNQLVCNNLNSFYWTSNNEAEIDFITRIKQVVIPIEVKSNEHVRSRSLSVYVNRYKPKYSIRISSKNFGFENNIKSIPLYAVFCIK